jgi:hypothetical protein
MPFADIAGAVVGDVLGGAATDAVAGGALAGGAADASAGAGFWGDAPLSNITGVVANPGTSTLLTAPGGYSSASDLFTGADWSAYDTGIGSTQAASSGSIGDLLKSYGIPNNIANALSSPGGLAAAAAAIYGLSGGATPKKVGFQGTIPTVTASRQQIPVAATNPYSGKPVMGQQMLTPVTYAAEGGIMQIPNAHHPHGRQARYLRGDTDGMADKIDTTIDNKEPAKLSHGEFVIPADVVSHLGNGNSDAGANVLYKMMDRVRHARTGTKKQGKEIDAEKFTPGGQAYKDGGDVKAFAVGGGADSPSSGSVLGASPYGYGSETTLSSWAAPYITDMLSKGQALSNMPYQPYTGALTAGDAPLQTQAYTAASKLGYDPNAVSSYMSPYMQNVVQAEQQDAQRQADIANQGLGAQFANSGAFGGGRFGVQQAQNAQNLALQKQGIEAAGLQNAFQNAQQAQQFKANYDINAMNAQLQAGGQQQATAQSGINALLNQYQQQQMYPYSQLQFEQSLLNGLPISAVNYSPSVSGIQTATNFANSIAPIYNTVNKIWGSNA